MLNTIFDSNIFKISSFSFNRMFENAKEPSKWILNYKFKAEKNLLTNEDKQLQDSCRLIESYVVDTKPRRHGQGEYNQKAMLKIKFNLNIFISDGALSDPYTGGDINKILAASDGIIRKVSFKNLKYILFKYRINFFETTSAH